MRLMKNNFYFEISGLEIAEFIGVICGIAGAFLVANGFFKTGYPLFTLSALLLFFTAYKQFNKNLMLLQFVFLCANINGMIHFFGGF